MAAVERDSDGSPLCPRCGGKLHRQRRRLVHRLVSIVYPVRAYACTPECTWSGALPSASGRERRRQQAKRALVVLMLLAAGGLFIWKYGADLTWSPAPPSASEGSEE